jgi:ribosomal-protein-alanine N-acetyltransferase
MAEIFKTRRLSLRHAEPADADFFVALLNDPGFLANIGDRGVRTKGDAEAYLAARIVPSYARDGFGFFVTEHVGEPVGICGLIRRDGLDAPDLGFAFLEKHVRRGFGLEAATATIAWARDVVRLDRILAITKINNSASIALLGRLAFLEVGMVEVPSCEDPSRRFELILDHSP